MMRGNFKLRHYPKTVLTPLKWDVCITPESRHRSATLPIAISSSATAERSPLTSTWLPRCIALTTRLSETAPLGSKPFLTVDIACVTLNGRSLPRQSKFI
jgi:hypothetical protein